MNPLYVNDEEIPEARHRVAGGKRILRVGQPSQQRGVGLPRIGARQPDEHRADQQVDHRAEQGHRDPEHLGDIRDLGLAEAHVDIEDVGNGAQHDVGDAIGGDQCQHQQRQPAIAAEEIGELCAIADMISSNSSFLTVPYPRPPARYRFARSSI